MKDGKIGVLYIYDEISPWGVTAQSFATALQDALNDGAEKIEVYINSPGGDVFDAIAIYNSLKELDNLEIIIMGMAASAASFIAMASDNVRIMSNARIMIHNPWTWAAGDADYLRKVEEHLQELQDEIIGIYQDKTDQSKEQIQEWMNEEEWFKADKAVEYGFADEVVKPGKLRNLVRGIFNIFNRADFSFDKPKKETEMDEIKLKLISLFGLAAMTVANSVEDIMSAINKKWAKAQEKITELTTAKEDLETKLQNALDEAKKFVDEKITAVLDDAVSEERITEAERAVWEPQLRENFEETIKLLEQKQKGKLGDGIEPPEPVKSEGETLTTQAANLIRNQMKGAK